MIIQIFSSFSYIVLKNLYNNIVVKIYLANVFNIMSNFLTYIIICAYPLINTLYNKKNNEIIGLNKYTNKLHLVIDEELVPLNNFINNYELLKSIVFNENGNNVIISEKTKTEYIKFYEEYYLPIKCEVPIEINNKIETKISNDKYTLDLFDDAKKHIKEKIYCYLFEKNFK